MTTAPPCRRPTRPSLPLAALPWLLTGLACQDPDRGVQTPASQLIAQAITDGEPALEDPAVATVLSGQKRVCTGTLVNQHLVLTAAHCLGYQPTSVLFDDLPVPITISTAVAHPSYDRRTHRFDMALLVLAGAVTTVKPVPLTRANELFLEPGTLLRLVGFGETETETAWRKRQGMAEVADLDAESIRLAEGMSRACQGDSGGPALVGSGADGEDQVMEFVAGVISRGDQDCAARTVLARVDSQYDGFIREFDRLDTAKGRPARARCLSDDNCESGKCAVAVGSRSTATCSHECTTDEDCGARGFVCDVPARLCRRGPPFPGSFLTACTADGECDSALCAAAAAGDPRLCTRACQPDDAASCDQTSICVPSSEGTPANICLPRQGVPPARLGSGCAMGGPGRGAAPAGGLGGLCLLGLLGALLLRWHRPVSRRG